MFKQFIKELLCKHEYNPKMIKTHEIQTRFIESGEKETFEYFLRFKHCDKCGKGKPFTNWELLKLNDN